MKGDGPPVAGTFVSSAPMSDDLPTLFKLTDVAERYGWSMDTLYEYVRRGELVAARIGKNYHVTPEALRQFVASRGTAIAPPVDAPSEQPAPAGGPTVSPLGAVLAAVIAELRQGYVVTVTATPAGRMTE